MSSADYFCSAHVILTQVGRRGEQRLLPLNILLRCPLACPNSAPWCLICTMTFAPPSLCLCSSSSAPLYFHNRRENDRALSITPTSSGKLFSPPAVFLHVMFSLSRRQFRVSPAFADFSMLVFCLPNFCVPRSQGCQSSGGVQHPYPSASDWSLPI